MQENQARDSLYFKTSVPVHFKPEMTDDTNFSHFPSHLPEGESMKLHANNFFDPEDDSIVSSLKRNFCGVPQQSYQTPLMPKDNHHHPKDSIPFKEQPIPHDNQIFQY